MPDPAPNTVDPTVRTSPAGPAAPAAAPAPDAPVQEQHHGPDLATQVATVAALPFTLVRTLLPDSPVPVALGTGALAVAGVIEWPVAAAVGLGYLALRRWYQPLPGSRDAGRQR